MTPAQRAMYFREWKKALAAMEELGRKITDERDERVQIHRSVGAPDSTTQFSNAHLDKVLAAFWAWSHPVSFKHQERQVNQPGRRCMHLCMDIMRACNEIQPGTFDMDKSEAYVIGLFRKLNPDCPKEPAYAEAEWSKPITAMTYRYDQVVRSALGRPRQRSRRVEHHPSKHAKWMQRVQFLRARKLQEAQLQGAGHKVDCPF